MPSEIDTVLVLLKEAATWLRDRGIDYWQEWHSPLGVRKQLDSPRNRSRISTGAMWNVSPKRNYEEHATRI